MRRLIVILLIGCSLMAAVEGQEWKQYPFTPEGSLISFPKDEGLHVNESSEWWYMAGHLTGIETGNPYSFMVSYFYYPAFGYDGFRILNIARDDTGEFFTDAQGLHYTDMSEDSLNIQATLMNGGSESWIYQSDSLGRTNAFDYEISAFANDGGLQLSSESLKNPLILGDSGYFDLGVSAYTYYYSFTGNQINGSINFGEISEEVTGTAWIDKQYGTFSPATEEVYEWFSVNLSNGMDLVVWDLFTVQNQLPDESAYRHMSVWQDSVTQFTTHDYQLERLSYAYMPDGVICYAQSWHLSSEEVQMDLMITTLNSHGDVQLPFRFYEGATSVSGTVNGVPVTGRGFAELIKSYEAPEPTILYPQGGTWKDSLRIGWTLLNPDDGYNLSYDLEYSTDNGITYEYIKHGIGEKEYMWYDPRTLERGDSCWFRVSAYSPDSTLSGIATSQKASVYEPDSATFIDLQPALLKSEIVLFPNPAKEYIIIKGMQSDSFLYSIYNTTGKKVLTGINDHSAKELKIYLSNLQQGIYLILINDGEEKPQAIKFLIKQ